MTEPVSEPDQTPHARSLPRVLTRFDGIALVVGSIIGSGIFLKPSIAAGHVQSFSLEVGVWLFVGLVTLCGSLALGELAGAMPHAGGPYVYLREAYGRVWGFLWGWTEFWVIRTGSIGALACATAIYLDELIPLGRSGQLWSAVAIVLGLAAVNAIATRWGASLQNLTTLIKVLFLAALIVLPSLMRATNVQNLEPIWPTETGVPLWRGLGLALIAVLWPYDGWINIAPVAEEMHNPQRNVPIALAVGMAIITSVYVGVVTAYHLVLPMDEMIASDRVAADVCRVLFGETGSKIAALAVVCSTFGACNANMLTGPRIYFAMARDGLLARSVCTVHGRFRTPANAIVLQALWAVVLIFAAFHWKSGSSSRPIDAFDVLTDMVIFAGTLFYAMAVGAVFVLRWKRPDLERPYRTWGYPVTPAGYLLMFSGAMVSMLIDKWQETLAGLSIMLLGLFYYLWAVRRAARQNTSDPSSTIRDP